MAGYIYLPVATQEMVGFAKDWQAGQKARGFVPYEILKNYEAGWRKGFVRGVGRGVLRNLSAQDKLFVLCHGKARGSNQIGVARGAKLEIKAGVGEWEGGRMKAYDPTQLALVTQKEGLLKSFVDLRLFICGSAVTPAGQGQSFAQRYAVAMGILEYAHLRVTGYLGSVRSDYAQRNLGTGLTPETHKGVEINGSVQRAANHTLVFNSTPAVAPPADPAV
jgi:hypothetical protein